MGRGGTQENSHHSSKGKRKSKGRMSYLQRFRNGGGKTDNAKGSDGKVDEYGQKFGDYVPAYGSGSKQSWRNHGGGWRREYIKPGMKGFLCTTNFKETECVREAYNILNEYNEGMTVGQSGGEISQPCCENADADMERESKPKNGEEEIDDALTTELKNLRSEKSVKKFQRVETGVSNVIFISTTIDEPEQLAFRIFDDVTTKKQSKSRYLLRLLPIEVTCNASINDDLKSKCRAVIEKYLKTGYPSFRVVANVRLNNKLKKDDFIKTLADLVSQVNPLSFVDLNNAQFTIVVEVLKTTLCLGVVKDFTKFKKYNLLEAGSNRVPVPEKISDDKAEAATVISEADASLSLLTATPIKSEGATVISEADASLSVFTATPIKSEGATVISEADASLSVFTATPIKSEGATVISEADASLSVTTEMPVVPKEVGENDPDSVKQESS